MADETPSERLALAMVHTLYRQLDQISRNFKARAESVRQLVEMLRKAERETERQSKNPDVATNLADCFLMVAVAIESEADYIAAIQDRIRRAGMAPE